MWSRLGVLAVVACGRIDFEPIPLGTRDGDAGPVGDGAADSGDGGQPTSCTAPAPFVYLVAPREEGSTGASVEVTWCSAGIPGVLAVSLMKPDGVTVHASTTAPISANTGTFLVFGPGGSGCFVRLEIGAFRYDGPPGEHLGD